ncbi:MAG: FUSC family protein [Sphingomonadales bacterium]|nr:FUSC family protein [Sphingomonadales bacterium]MDE2169619.1 FUSC family protein [Sphingomonadales bacterium]
MSARSPNQPSRLPHARRQRVPSRTVPVKALPQRAPSPRGTLLRRMARKLEVRAIGLVPEMFSPAEGLRAAAAMALPLALTLATGQIWLSWSIFAAVWTCLCVAPGTPRTQKRRLALFVVLGTMMTFAGSWLASWGDAAAFVAGPLLVFLAIMLPSRLASATLLATLLGVVGVVAVGFPLPAGKAVIEALAFLMGAGWAWLLVHGLWRMEEQAPLDLAVHSVVARLGDMAEDLLATGEGPHRDAQWHGAHGEHRRTVRLALERLGGLLPLYADAPPGRLAPYLRAQEAAETLFSALVALDHAFILQTGPAHERLAVARTFHGGLAIWRRMAPVSRRAHRAEARRLSQVRNGMIERWITLVERRQARLRDPAMRGCLLALGDALRSLREGRPHGPALSPPRPVSRRAALRQGLRQACGVLLVYAAARALDLGYPYWGTMAVVVVLQPGTRVTGMRALERIAGSLLGGVGAALLLHHAWPIGLLAALCVVLAAFSIALRSVNYTSFVVFLTVLFVTVTALLHPGEGIPMARILDNTVGSLVALLCVLTILPDRRPPLRATLREALLANRAYLHAVDSGAPFAQVHAARRAAGLASIELEIALHDPGWLFQRLIHRDPADRADLAALRLVAGQAATAWHERLDGLTGDQP